MTESTFTMQQHDTSSADCWLRSSAEFRISVRSLPYLADHGFQDMVVLPGSFFIETALRVDRARTKRVPGFVRNVIFHNPVILSAEDTVIRLDVRDHGDSREYTFYEGGVDDGGTLTPARQFTARLEIDGDSALFPTAGTAAFSIEAFQAQSHSKVESERFYKTLRENGNQYGPSFQNISSIWRAGDQSLGRLSVPRRDREVEPHALHLVQLDSMTQLLAPFLMEKGKTFLLRSIEKIEIVDAGLPETLWGHATLLRGHETDGNGLVGNVRVFDESGKLHLDLSGIAFTFLDSDETTREKIGTNLVIASNFTAEPIEDSLNFWADRFGVPIHLRFAPYSQIFQQLLETGSAFRENLDGVNVILLGLEEWATQDRRPVMPLSRERAAQSFGDHAKYVLPNGMEIVHLNHYETDYLYKEIFDDQCYLRHGIGLQDGDTVVDVGANIGLFSLFVLTRCKNPRIYAFEPSPVVCDLLKANCDAYGSNVRAVNAGVSDASKTATLTFYEKSSVFSGFHADETEDREAIQTVVRNTLKNEKSVEDEAIEEYVNELIADRLRRSTHECRMTSVSDIIRENGIDRIDLLKIDAEKSESDIIKGIEDDDWPKIAQIVIEIHDRTYEAVKRIEDLLIEKGFRCAVEQERLLEDSGLFNLYATRAEATGTSQACRKTGSLQRNTQELCAALASFMNKPAAASLVLCVCPRTPAAEADADLKAALSDAEQTLLSQANAIPNVHTVSSASLLSRYPVKDYYDPHSHQLGHIPYTPECYAAIGSAVFRTLFGLNRKPFKVIVLDCDNTLWKGVCGEDGPLGVEVSAPYRALQEFMVGQMHAGMLLCLCSKNNEKDVLDVFDQQTDMVLKREHLVSQRVNWDSKSENIHSLAAELHLGMDSFIFIDDNPVDCADVRLHCPGVLTLQLPPHSESFPAFLNHVWAFDHTRSTEEDRHRTRMYRESTERQQFREQVFSLKEFIKGLQLRVEIVEAVDEQLARASQLTFRTNQFNFTTVRRSDNEIRDFVRREHATCLVVHVADRFGDYGLVGVVMYEASVDRYKVDTLLLSCRVLGRGVEHALLSQLGQRAVSEGKRFVELTYRPTERNLPAMKFLKSIGDRNEANTVWTFPADRLASLEYNPDEKTENGCALTTPNPDMLTPLPALGLGVIDQSKHLQWIAESLYDIDCLAKAIEEHRLRKDPLQGKTDVTADVVTGNILQTALLKIWKKVLSRPRLGLNDNFFEAGGTSLRAVQVIASIKKELQQNVSIVSLFECPTVTLLAAKLSGASEERNGGANAAEAALERGRQRRTDAMRRRAS